MQNKSLFVLLCLSFLLLPTVHTYGCDDCQHSFAPSICCLAVHRCCQEAIANLLNTRSLPQCKSTSDNLVAQPRLVSILSYLFYKIHVLFSQFVFTFSIRKDLLKWNLFLMGLTRKAKISNTSKERIRYSKVSRLEGGTWSKWIQNFN